MLYKHTRMSFSTTSLDLYFVFIFVTAENAVSHRYVVANGNKMFTALLDNSRYSVDTLSQKADKDFSRNWIFRVRSHNDCFLESSRGPPGYPSRTPFGPRTPVWKPLLYGYCADTVELPWIRRLQPEASKPVMLYVSASVSSTFVGLWLGDTLQYVHWLLMPDCQCSAAPSVDGQRTAAYTTAHICQYTVAYLTECWPNMFFFGAIE